MPTYLTDAMQAGIRADVDATRAQLAQGIKSARLVDDVDAQGRPITRRVPYWIQEPRAFNEQDVEAAADRYAASFMAYSTFGPDDDRAAIEAAFRAEVAAVITAHLEG